MHLQLEFSALGYQPCLALTNALAIPVVLYIFYFFRLHGEKLMRSVRRAHSNVSSHSAFRDDARVHMISFRKIREEISEK